MAATLALAQTDTKPRNDDFVTIFGSNDDGTIKMDDPRDQTEWNPPAFGAGSSVRGLTFVVTDLPLEEQNVTIKITNLCLQGLKNPPPPISQSGKVQPDPDGKTGKATVTFPHDTDPVAINILVAILKKIRKVINLIEFLPEYHLNGSPDACSLFKAELSLGSSPDSVYRTWYYWAMGEFVVP